jgi:hypothetical protein
VDGNCNGMVSIPQLSIEWDVPDRTIRHWAETNVLRGLKIDNKWWFPADDVRLSTPVENSPLRRSKNPHLIGSRPLPEAGCPFCPLSLISGTVPRTARSGQGRGGFARRSGPLTARTVL